MQNLLDILRPRRNGDPSHASWPGEEKDRRTEPRLEDGTSVVAEWYDDQGAHQKETVTIRDRSAGGMSILVPQALPVGQTVWMIEEPNPPVKTVVRHGHPTSEGFVAGLILVRRERRREDRVPVVGDGVLSWPNAGSTRGSAPVVVRNATEFGVQVECPVRVPVPAIVRLTGSQLECSGSTCYCLPHEGQFLVGIHLVSRPYDKHAPQFEND